MNQAKFRLVITNIPHSASGTVGYVQFVNTLVTNFLELFNTILFKAILNDIFVLFLFLSRPLIFILLLK